MKSITAGTMELKGTNYEIGRSMGKLIAAKPSLKAYLTSGFPGFSAKEMEEAVSLFSRWCPGLPEELCGFADALDTPAEKIIYFAMTYLRPNCSQLALLPSKTANGHPLIARSYEFNDQGLSVTMSSVGLPVGAPEGMRRPAIKGLQFWAVIRSVLENCRDVAEGISLVKEMPIAYNLNMILADRHGNATLVETLDGRMAFKSIDMESAEQYLYAANHPLLKDIIPSEPQTMANSLRRCETIRACADGEEKISVDRLKSLLFLPYPEGLCCHCYDDFFGTTKSMIIDPSEGSIELCWGGRTENGWRKYCMSEPFPNTTFEIQLEKAVTYIEAHLKEPVRVDEAARYAGYSYYHLTRQFNAVLGESVGNYIRRRKLADAAGQLLHSRRRILDIALDYGFESSEAFSRAFKSIYGISPTAYRKNNHEFFYAAKPQMNYDRIRHLAANISIHPKIAEFPPVKTAGLRGQTSLEHNILPKLWDRLNQSLSGIPHIKQNGRGFGICEACMEGNSLYTMNQQALFSEVVSVEVESYEGLTGPFVPKNIEGGRYAVFTHTGTLARLPHTFDYIWGTWLLTTKEELDFREDFELYDQRFLGYGNAGSQMDIYIPVK